MPQQSARVSNRTGGFGRVRAGLAVAMMSAAMAIAVAPAANADDWLNRPTSGVFAVRGHAEGHGRGMSQYGAQGAATQGLTSTRILDFYYPGTAATQVDPNRSLRVWIQGDDDLSTEVVRTTDLVVRDDGTGAVISIPTEADRVRTLVFGSGFVVQVRVGGAWQELNGAAAAVPGAAAASAPSADSTTGAASPPAADPDAVGLPDTFNQSAAAGVTSGQSSDAGGNPTPEAGPSPSSAPAMDPPAAPSPAAPSPAAPSSAAPSSAAPSSAAPSSAAPTPAAPPTQTAPSGLRSAFSSGRQAAAAVTAGGPVSFTTGSGIVDVMMPSGTRNGYRGVVRAVRNGAGALTVDTVGLDDYVRAVVPRESPSSWRPAALESQAVAARSYANGYRSPNGNYDICDTGNCQVYGGATRDGLALEVTSTNQATDATRGLVRTYNGAPINAQFGSTNGGWTVDGGVPYLPAQVDPYEAVANPPQAYANWTGTLTAASLESRFPAIGTFLRIRITQRDGNGEWGGRVLRAVIEGSRGSMNLTGDQLRLTLTANVRSAYYQIFDIDSGSVPIGSLDYLGGAGSTFIVSGWALDPNDATTSLLVHVYDTAPSGAASVSILTAGGLRGDVAAAYPGAGPAHGFSAQIPLSGRGTHRICLYAINIGGGTGNTTLGCRPVEVGGPFGALDGVSGGAGYFGATGWTIDPNVPTAATDVHIYDSGPAGTVGYPGFSANQPRGDVGATFPGSGNGHGFTAFIPVNSLGAHTVCAYAIGIGGGPNSQVGCRNVTVVNPIGRLDAVAVRDGLIIADGWTLNPGSPTSALEVHIYIQGPGGNQVGIPGTIAGNDRSDIAAAFPGAGSLHGFTRVVPAAGSGVNQVCAYAISNGPSTANPQLGCLLVNVP